MMDQESNSLTSCICFLFGEAVLDAQNITSSWHSGRNVEYQVQGLSTRWWLHGVQSTHSLSP